jgi:hypothetical protein
MARTKKTLPCGHCGKEFTQARKDQKYCSAQCRFDHFFQNRDNEKERLEAQLETLENENAMLKERLAELLAPPPKKSKAKVAASQKEAQQ